MRALLCTSFGGVEALSLAEIPAPSPAPGEVLVRVKAAALNFFDTLIVAGKYQVTPALPFSPAAEIAGVVERLGAGVDGPPVGTRVHAYLGWGGASELVAISADRLVAIPDPIDDPVAAGLSVTYGTAMHGLVDRAKLGAGETLLVLGAAGGAGLAAVEIGAKLGARVIAAASSGDKLAVAAEHGASAGIDYATESLRGRSNDLTGGGGVDVVYDCVGGAHAEPAFRSIAWGGRYLVVGFASGAIPKLPLNLPLLKGASIVGVYWGEFLQRQPASQRRNLESVIGWVASGAIKPKVHASYPLARFRDAFAAIENRQAIGKVILTP